MHAHIHARTPAHLTFAFPVCGGGQVVSVVNLSIHCPLGFPLLLRLHQQLEEVTVLLKTDMVYTVKDNTPP